MNINLHQYIDNIISSYSSEFLSDAQKEYFKLTGSVNEDDDDYESKMNLFHDWYVLNFIPLDTGKKILSSYIDSSSINNEVGKAINSTVNYSLFKYNGLKSQGRNLVLDLINKEKYQFLSDIEFPAIVKGDIFVGRSISLNQQNILFKGVCILPKEISSTLLEKIINKLKMSEGRDRISSLLRLEFFTFKFARYKHLSAEQVFKYS